jgi:hypothetical protein
MLMKLWMNLSKRRRRTSPTFSVSKFRKLKLDVDGTSGLEKLKTDKPIHSKRRDLLREPPVPKSLERRRLTS